MILREKYKADPEGIVAFYLKHTRGINNWDLVDLSAPYILGSYLIDKADRQVIYELAASPVMWERRIAIVSTLMLIRNRQFEDTIKLAEILLFSEHDLMQKAVGWMLREVGKKDENLLKNFLNIHCQEMPRTMLRYAIEKFPPAVRQEYMSRV